MIIEFFAKNMALVETLVIDTVYVPRIGETIKTDEAIYLVHDVIHIMADGKLTPCVRCHEGGGHINRRIVLEENGWL